MARTAFDWLRQAGGMGMTAFFVGLDTAIAMFKRWRWLILALPLALALGVQTCRLKGAEGKLDKARAAIAQMQLASEQARAAQVALNAANQQLAERIAENATLAHIQNRAAVSNAVADYSAAHGLRKACGSLTGQADRPAVPGDPRAPDQADAINVVAVPRSDFEALTDDALRGAEARAFLIDLANEGLAVVR